MLTSQILGMAFTFGGLLYREQVESYALRTNC